MTIHSSAPWHKISFDKFLQEGLPQLLGERLPLAGYQAESTDANTCRITLTLLTREGEMAVAFDNLPQPDEEGVILVDGRRRVCLPVASSDELDKADVKCVGEQLLDFVEERLGQVPEKLPHEEALIRALVPLDAWFREFMETGYPFWGLAYPERAGGTMQDLFEINYLQRQKQLRTIFVGNMKNVFHPSQIGRADPFETPEGPNIGHVLSMAVGAEIRDGKIVVVDDRPEAALGLTSSMVPFLEHDDANRLLMGVNMMRQWQVPLEPEPALVQTGNEINAPGFWCGVNLLTAFVSWGADTHEDAILISESCAKRFRFKHPIEPGDKISNRHGSKGTISRIAPDDEMPHLTDGTAVELVYNYIGILSRLTMGQVREAVMGRIAQAEGGPVVVPPFHAPSVDEIHARLKKNHLPESGMEMLRKGKNGPALQRPSTVGWVYWGRTLHDVRDKMHASASPSPWLNGWGELDYYSLRDCGAFENIAEGFNTRSDRRPNAANVPGRVVAGPVAQAPAPSPWFEDLSRRLRVAGIAAELDDEKLSFCFGSPGDQALRLAIPIAHPWLRERGMTEIGTREGDPLFQAMVDANRKVERLLANRVPESLIRKAVEQLEHAAQAFFDGLVKTVGGSDPYSSEPGASMQLRERNLFSGRSVMIPGGELRLGEVGLPEAMAWELFGPLVARELGGDAEVKTRSARAAEALKTVMARNYLLVNRAPSFWTASVIALRPVCVPGRAIRFHPLLNRWLNADYDGDQLAVFVPLTDAAQKEAGELLTVEGHLRHNIDLLKFLGPVQDMVWGLSEYCRTQKGRAEVTAMFGSDICGSESLLADSAIVGAVHVFFEREGAEKTMELLDGLMRLGFEKALESGASISPFIGETLEWPPAPKGESGEEWLAYSQEVAERIVSRTDYDDPDMGPQLLSVKTRARGSLSHLVNIAGLRGAVRIGLDNRIGPIKHGYSRGLAASEVYACVLGAREGLAEVSAPPLTSVHASLYDHFGVRRPSLSPTFTVLARAMRSPRPGTVFARAAAIGETDPLTDLDSRLFVGLPPKAR